MTLFVETKKCRYKKVIKNNIELVAIDENLKDIKNRSNDFIINVL